MFKKFYIVQDNGDGSASVRWFDSESEAQSLIDDDPETYGQNDDVGYVESAEPITVY